MRVPVEILKSIVEHLVFLSEFETNIKDGGA